MPAGASGQPTWCIRRHSQECAFFADLTCVILFVISAIVLFGVSLPALSCLCDQGCRKENDISSDDAQEKEDIASVCDEEDSIRQLYLLGFGVGFVMAALQCAGFVYGRRLVKHHYFVSSAVNANAAGFVPTAHPVQAQPPHSFAAQGGGGYSGAQDHQVHSGGYRAPTTVQVGTSYPAPLYDAPTPYGHHQNTAMGGGLYGQPGGAGGSHPKTLD